MPPKNCGRCDKQVYPVDELKCLDKVWHKGCFKCQVCGMTLNMKNYKGFEKQPYCVAHYPEIKHTQVAETPESKRIAENTKIQSQVKYHEDFEKNKGAKISVADDPETMRVRKNMQTISQVVYHGELEKKQLMEDSRPSGSDSQPPSASVFPPPQAFSYPVADAGGAAAQARQPPVPTSPVPQQTPLPPSAAVLPRMPAAAVPQQQRAQPAVQQQPAPAVTAVPQRPAPAVTTVPQRPAPAVVAAPQRPAPAPAVVAAPQQRSAPAFATASPAQRTTSAVSPPQRQQSASLVQTPTKLGPKGRMVKALYDYKAADTDEVTFREDDVIVLCDPIDDGWLIGTVEKTGRRGMLPSNYVSKLNW